MSEKLFHRRVYPEFRSSSKDATLRLEAAGVAREGDEGEERLDSDATSDGSNASREFVDAGDEIKFAIDAEKKKAESEG